MRPENTIEYKAARIFKPGDEFDENLHLTRYAVLGFTNEKLLDSFINYLKKCIFTRVQSNHTSVQDVPNVGSVFNYYVGDEKNVCSESLTVLLMIKEGMDNLIGKFFLETGLYPPSGFAYDHFDPYFFHPGSFYQHYKYSDYLRGVPKIRLGGISYEISVPENVILELQARPIQPVIDKAQSVIDESRKSIVSVFTNLLATIPTDIWSIIVSCISYEDIIEISDKVHSSKPSFFERHVPGDKNHERVKEVLRSVLKSQFPYWQTLRCGDNPLNIEAGINQTSQRPALAHIGKQTGYMVILDEEDKLVVKDKSNGYKDVNAVTAFLIIRNFGLNLLFWSGKIELYRKVLVQSLEFVSDEKELNCNSLHTQQSDSGSALSQPTQPTSDETDMNESDTEMNERDTDMDANESESENENENELNSTAQQNASGSVLTQQSILGNKNLDQSAQKKESAKHSKCLVM